MAAGSPRNPKIPFLAEKRYETKCDCVLVCIFAHEKSHVDIYVMIRNCYLKSVFFLVGFQQWRRDRECWGRVPLLRKVLTSFLRNWETLCVGFFKMERIYL